MYTLQKKKPILRSKELKAAFSLVRIPGLPAPRPRRPWQNQGSGRLLPSSREKRLHVLFDNAGVMNVAPSKEKPNPAELRDPHGGQLPGNGLVHQAPGADAERDGQDGAAGSVRVVRLSSTADLAEEKDVGSYTSNLGATRSRSWPGSGTAAARPGTTTMASNTRGRIEDPGVIDVVVIPGNLSRR
ncbi:hypothetical protein DL764_006215 [Monosporascus ibericus]|uniref:Uncharacterized protein n=1 Tax=Monosporascus ibericus TaxID=155417 RepID=A0A4Q4T8V2_9PEZI|nr:hypothetical protein DL764_006215 [Monosporascus ibericus]